MCGKWGHVDCCDECADTMNRIRRISSEVETKEEESKENTQCIYDVCQEERLGYSQYCYQCRIEHAIL